MTSEVLECTKAEKSPQVVSTSVGRDNHCRISQTVYVGWVREVRPACGRGALKARVGWEDLLLFLLFVVVFLFR